jgi:hypothetical protein
MVNSTKAETGKISKSDLLTGTLTASYGPEFPMPVRFVVSGFDLVIEQRGIFTPFTSNDNTISNNQKSVIRAMSSGQYIILKNVKVKGPGGFITLPSYSLQIQ